MGLTEFTKNSSEKARRSTVILSPWNQVGARVFFSPAHCYPLDNSKAEEAISTIRGYLDVLGLVRPETAGRISAVPAPSQKGLLALTLDPDNDRIPLDVLYEEETYGQTYEEIKAKNFPPSAFVNPIFTYDGKLDKEGATRPTFRVLAVVIKGGLILGYYFHHSVFDGYCMKVIFQCLEAVARGEAVVGTPRQDQSFIKYDPIKDDEELAQIDPAKFPELDLPHFLELPGHSQGPQPADFSLEGTGRQFRFRNKRLMELQELVKASDEAGRDRLPTTYMCLAALAWSHICKARSAAEVLRYRGTNPASSHLAAAAPPRLIVPVNWAGRALFRGRAAGSGSDYFGNASFGAMAAGGSARQLLDAARGDAAALARLVRAIERDVAAQLTEAAVAARTALYARVGDVSRLGWRIDPLSAADTVVNTWRFLGGADMRWGAVPGLGGDRPEAVRRCAGRWATGYTCVMPGRLDAGFQELLVMLPTAAAMEALCADEEWMRWVDMVLD